MGNRANYWIGRADRCLRLLPLLALLSAALAPGAGAVQLEWQGTLTLDFIHPALPSVSVAGVGVATVSAPGGGVHLTHLQLAGGITGSAVEPVASSAAPLSIVEILAVLTLGSGSFYPFAPAETGSGPQLEAATLPVRGFVRLCLLFVGCSQGVQLDLTAAGGQVGLGVGGLLTVGGASALRLSLQAAPWTLQTASIPLVSSQGQTLTITARGWVHGANSFTSSTAVAGGALSLVTPLAVTAADGSGALSSFARITLRFVPEPAAAWLLASGIVGLVLLGRIRIRP